MSIIRSRSRGNINVTWCGGHDDPTMWDPQSKSTTNNRTGRGVRCCMRGPARCGGGGEPMGAPPVMPEEKNQRRKAQ